MKVNKILVNKILGHVLFWLTVPTPLISFALASEIGEVDIFGVAGITRYSWVMWLFIPLPIASFLVGLNLKRAGQRYLKNFIIMYICLPLLILFGSYRFIFPDSYDPAKVVEVETETHLDLPNNVKIATTPFDNYELCHLKILDSEEKEAFKKEVVANSVWKTVLSTNIKGVLPISMQYEWQEYDFYMFYNLTTGEYNTYPPLGKSVCVFIAYNVENQHLVIFDKLEVEIY